MPKAEASDKHEAPRRDARFPCLTVLAGVVLLAAVLLVGGVWMLRSAAPVLTQETARQAVVTTVQEEAASSFLVTGYLETSVTSTVRNTEIFLPGVLDLPLGTAASTVRVPGRIYYGFDVRRLEAEDIHLHENGQVTVQLPDLRLHSVSPDLSEMQVQTEAGWMRRYDDAGDRVERTAIRRVQAGLRAQGERHLQTSVQPRINTARALEEMLRAAFEAAGYEAVQVRIRLSDDLVLEPAG